MALISKIFVFLVEFILLLLFAIPLIAVLLSIVGDFDPNNILDQWFGSTFILVLSLVAYYLILVFTFGILSIIISNYQNLNRIAELLESQVSIRKVSDPKVVELKNTDNRREEPPVSNK